MGKRSLDSLQRSIGDTVTVDTGSGPVQMKVVGSAAFPGINHGSFSTLGLGVGAMARAEAFPSRSIEEESEVPPEVDTADFGCRGHASHLISGSPTPSGCRSPPSPW